MAKKEFGTINLKDISSVSPTNYKGRQFCLAVSTHKRTYYLLSENNEEMQGWKEAIQKQIDFLLGKIPVEVWLCKLLKVPVVLNVSSCSDSHTNPTEQYQFRN